MSSDGAGASPRIRSGGRVGRVAALGALALAVIAVVLILFTGGDDGNRYRLLFETGGQLVEGNEVLIGGTPVGSVDSIELADDAQAEIEITVDTELHEGTSAVIRSTSLSGVANRYIAITPGPDNAPKLGEDALITQVDTTTPVDLDQLFNTIREPERKALQDIIQGSADVYAGRGREANQTYRYLSPSLTATTKLIQELNADQQVFSDFLVSGSRAVGAIAERRDDLAELTSNGNEALGAIASENRNLDRALQALPPALRQANTTFFNLRPTLDDLDELVDVAKPTTRDLYPFLKQVRPLIGKSVPVFSDLRIAVNKPGKDNDLADAMARLGPLRKAADSASEPTVQAMVDSEPTFTFLRPYAPDLLNTIGKLGADHGELRRQRPHRQGAARRDERVREQRRLARPDLHLRPVRRLRALRRRQLQGLPPLPRRPDPARRRRVEPVPRQRPAHLARASRRLHRCRRPPGALTPCAERSPSSSASSPSACSSPCPRRAATTRAPTGCAPSSTTAPSSSPTRRCGSPARGSA